MSRTEVKVALRDGGLAVREWVQPCQSDLFEIIQAVENVKQSVNECLTNLITENGNRNVKYETEFADICEDDEEEEDEVNNDSISGFIKNVTIGVDHPTGKRKSNNLNTAKRFKK